VAFLKTVHGKSGVKFAELVLLLAAARNTYKILVRKPEGKRPPRKT
jgi:hypothetical protein